MANKGFTGTQKHYLEGLASGLRLAQQAARAPQGSPVHELAALWRSRLARERGRADAAPVTSTAGSAVAAPSAAHPDHALVEAQDRFLRAGQRLSIEEKIKRQSPPEDLWERMQELARERRFPEAEESFLFKYHGLFYGSPLEEAFMCRLRFAAGRIKAHQLRGVADLAEQHAAAVLQLTTRSNIQLRGIAAESTIDVLTGLMDLGIITRGAGADGVRNVLASPTGGIDRRELIDATVLARDAHHRVLFTRGLQALPRKFTVAFDGGGAISALPETSDLGFKAVLVPERAGVRAGVYFRMLIGGATSHKRYARDAGVIIPPERAVDVLEQVLRLYIEQGDRTNRRRARLLYLVETWGMPRFMAELTARLERLEARAPAVSPSANGAAPEWAMCPPLIALELERCQLPEPPDPFAHIGFHNQKPRGKSYVGVVVPKGQLSVEQARGLAAIAEDFGSGELRLTPYQNMLIVGLSDTQLHRVKEALERLSLTWTASAFRSGLIACTGSTGCRFAAADVKARGEELVRALEEQFQLEQPLSIHLSGCHHACAQHTIADIGLLALHARTRDGAEESYQLWLGGQAPQRASFAREFASNVPASEVPRLIQRVMAAYIDKRRPEESFREFIGRVAPLELRRWTGERRGNGAWHAVSAGASDD